MELISFIRPYASYKLNEIYKKYFNELVDAQTSLGPIRGCKQMSSYGYEYVEFRSVPYGKPPVGDLRFRDPEPAEPWTEPLKTISDTVCCQRDFIFKHITGQEDCLRLNIYTKNLRPTKLYPVMVFIHGGAFFFGSNKKELFGPEFLLQKDVLLVVINYRLGAFGFLSLDDPKFGIPGNAGLKDQVLALKWINENVQNFGGDPGNITLFGESAGGCSVHYHMISEMSRGLFHKAIAMSGTALNIWAMAPINDIPERLAKNLGWNGEGGHEKVLEILRSVSADKLTKAHDNLINEQEKEKFLTFPCAPVIEPYKSKQCFIPKSPLLMNREAWSSDMPLMIGGCSGEGLYMHNYAVNNPEYLLKLNESFENVIPSYLELESDKGAERCKQLGAKVKEQYYANEDVTLANIDKYVQMLGDFWFWHGIHNTVQSRLHYSTKADTYLYRFDFDSKTQNHSKFIFANKGVPGSCHADDCSYLFKTAITHTVKKNSREYKTVQRMVDLWTSFAITGKPTIINEYENCDIWKPIDNENPLKCLNISDNLEFVNLPEYERMKFWDLLHTGIDLY